MAAVRRNGGAWHGREVSAASQSSTACGASCAAMSDRNNNVIAPDCPDHDQSGHYWDRGEEEGVNEQATNSLLNKLIRISLVESSHNLEVQQRDPSSPLYSVKSFEELHLKPDLLQGIYGMGFNRPSKIQATALPMILADPPQNLIAQSQSGTGKTAAFVLAMLSRVDVKKKYPQCICLSPTFELALQTGDVLKQMGKFCEGIDVIFAIRGNRPTRGSRIESQIIVGTPGTVMDWCFKLKLFNVENIKVFVLDEADVMIGCQGYSDHSVRVKRVMPPDCQMLLFSATFDESVWYFAERIVPNPNIIKVKKEDVTLKNIRQFYNFCESNEEKFVALCNMYGSMTIAQAIIFCQTRKTANWLSREMASDGHQVALLSGELSVSDRANIIQRFRDGKEKVLITTNVCARGIDIEQVSIVVNFDLPVTVEGLTDYETYLHRIGRTGRFGKKGVAISLVEKCFMYILRDIEEHFGTKIVQLDTGDFDEVKRLCC
ncbi:ATP-dependent RNA helicase DDX25 isoform X1 [Ranitomeya variabilis]|uniref:ATP-dependent RNA helicase DDX25 isoform X1 n=2 Tax=Ranitomeya variabilis TaxID=490064 RepID=UPI00405788E0